MTQHHNRIISALLIIHKTVSAKRICMKRHTCFQKDTNVFVNSGSPNTYYFRVGERLSNVGMAFEVAFVPPPDFPKPVNNKTRWKRTKSFADTSILAASSHVFIITRKCIQKRGRCNCKHLRHVYAP